MHPLRVLLLVSLVIALAVAWSFGAALMHAGTERAAAIVLAIAVFGAFLIPWTGVFWWAVRRAGDLDELTERARIAVDETAGPITDRTYHGELDDLARAIEQLRVTLVRQRADHQETRAAMDEILGSLGEGLLAVNATGRVVFANHKVREMFSPGVHVAGRSVLEVVRKQSVAAAVHRALAGETSTDRVTIPSEEGERQIEMRAVPVAAGAELAAVALFIDVTTLERLQRVRREFLDDFSHEVRTPLAGLRSAAETLQHGGIEPETEAQLRAVMQRQIGRIERLVNDLSELNRIESGQMQLVVQPSPLRPLLAGLATDLRGRHPGLEVTVGGEEVTGLIDEVRAQQIFSNLLDNAVRHGGGGAVEIDLGREGSEAVVRVSDQGPGIPPSEIEKIFHRFYRVDRSRSTPGTGLGLAIARHLALLHGGTIRAWNRPTGGATFEVRLPAELTLT